MSTAHFSFPWYKLFDFFLLQYKRAGLILESMLAFLHPFNVEFSMTQKFSSKLFGSNILDTKIAKKGNE
jgi:hypothetical protein